jgi:hypothetical protein
MCLEGFDFVVLTNTISAVYFIQIQTITSGGKSTPMLIQKLLVYICQAVSNIFKLQTDIWTWGEKPGSDGALCEQKFFGSYGPRILILRNDEIWQVTGLFTVVARYASAQKNSGLISCQILVRTLKQSDQIIYGQQKIHEYQTSH